MYNIFDILNSTKKNRSLQEKKLIQESKGKKIQKQAQIIKEWL